jgi:KUP system potassium uptake protein
MPLDDFIASIALAGTLDEQNKLHRSHGTAIFLSADPEAAPNALLKNVKHNQILHERNILLSIFTDRAHPFVPRSERVRVKHCAEGFYRLTAHFGFMETPYIEEVLRAAGEQGLEVDKTKATFFVGRERIVATVRRGMARWREHLFVFLTKHAENAADFFHLPPDRVYEVSQVVEI